MLLLNLYKILLQVEYIVLTLYLWSTEYFDFINNNFDVSNVGSFVDPITFQSRLSITDTSLYGSMEYRRQAR